MFLREESLYNSNDVQRIVFVFPFQFVCEQRYLLFEKIVYLAYKTISDKSIASKMHNILIFCDLVIKAIRK